MTKVFSVTMRGTVVGTIWMPAATCWKPFVIRNTDFRYSDSSQPSLRDMAERATNDGDFQSCAIAEGSVTVQMDVIANGRTMHTRTRHYDIAEFPSIADMVDTSLVDEIVYQEE